LATIVFTDIVGSTRLKQELGEREALSLIKAHHALIRETLNSFPGGEEIETAGDSFFLVFAKPSDAARFALLVQSRLRTFAQNGHSVQDRIGVHVGEVLLDGLGDPEQPQHPSGMHVDTCARVTSLAQGDQILLTRFAFDNARSVLRGEEIQGVGPLSWMNHGSYLLKGVEEPVEICEVGESRLASLKAPADVEKAHRQVSPGEEPVLGWRPALDQVVPNTKWVLERKLGEGGFGEVWLGRHEALKERRVFKFCFRADRVRSLKREVTLFRVMREKMGQHPNIVGIQEVFFDEPPFYIVMNYAEGQDLRAWCQAQGGAKQVPLATRLEIVAQVADGLQAAHEAGVIHRDIKPTNILIRESATKDAEGLSGEPAGRRIHVQARLTDFGIGQVVSEEALAGVTGAGFTQTMLSPGSSAHTGTQLYMAPELLAGQPASPGSDIYSLGMVLYQLLIEDFVRPLTIDWAKRIEDPLLREDLEKCFAGNPQERFASAGDLARNVRSLNRRRAEWTAQRRAVRYRRLGAWAAAGVAIAGMLILGLVYTFKPNAPSPRASRNPMAEYWYEKGRDALGYNANQQSLSDAVGFFGKAITNDTKCALAYVGLAQACRQLNDLYAPREGWGERAFNAASNAIVLAPKLAEAYVVRGALFYTPLRGWDAKQDVDNQRKALDLNDKVKNAHFNLALVYHHLGFVDEAIYELEQEYDVDKNDQTPLWLLGSTLLMKGEYEQGLNKLKDVDEKAFPHRGIGALSKATALFYCGKTNEAEKELTRTLSGGWPGDGLLISVQALLRAAAGDRVGMQQKIELATKEDTNFLHFHHIAYSVGSAYALQGQTADAIKWLQEAANEGYPCYPWLTIDPNLKKVRGDLSFKAFLENQRTNHEAWRRTLFGR
jgi:class 3 adenylate cyclase/tetratricopeptide (TPR) repeat protein/tRNA A-37 threonylcarbamoyl transferase component Bud32